MQSLSLSGGKHLLISKITSDEDVRFNWCIAAADFGEAEEKILLEKIIHGLKDHKCRVANMPQSSPINGV